ncbi:MAG: tetratricopeptide repeat protein [Thermodesulfobacteriota bacterium]|nr:tetratricopeptide repeat protein [Thermodesulfobacteriota bacterium]
MKAKARLFLIFSLTLAAAIAVSGCATTKKRKDQAEKTRRLGEAYMAEGKHAAAYKSFLKAKNLNPRDAHTYYDLGMFYYQKENYDMAIDAYHKALDMKPDFAAAINNLGIVYMAQGEWDKAINTLKDITENYVYATPHFPCFLIGQAYYHKKEYQKAVDYFKKAIDLKPDYPFASHWLGKTLLAQGNTGDAINALEKAVEQAPKNAAFYFDLGMAYKAAGNRQKARQAFSRAAAMATNESLRDAAMREKRHLGFITK